MEFHRKWDGEWEVDWLRDRILVLLHIIGRGKLKSGSLIYAGADFGSEKLGS